MTQWFNPETGAASRSARNAGTLGAKAMRDEVLRNSRRDDMGGLGWLLVAQPLRGWALFAESAGCGEQPAQYQERAEVQGHDRGNDARPTRANGTLAGKGEPVYNGMR